MFNVIMTGQDLNDGPITLDCNRIFEYTSTDIASRFQKNQEPDFDKIIQLPCLFMDEGQGDELAFVGTITRVRKVGREYLIEYVIDKDIQPITNSEIYKRRIAYNMPQHFEFSRNHWAIKDADLYRLLLAHAYPTRQNPKVFHLPTRQNVQQNLLSVMMPFDASFNAVYAAIQSYAKASLFQCKRADDIWLHDAIIQDIVTLIDQSRIVICDCSGRNPNVFYEAGIAHTLGRDVILITRNSDDIPFDLRHIRHIPYLNNAEGHQKLIEAIRDRVSTLVS